MQPECQLYRHPQVVVRRPLIAHDHSSRHRQATALHNRFLQGCCALVLLLAALTDARSESLPVEGLWITPNYNSIVKLTQCEEGLCAEIAWLWNIDVLGRKLLDEKNPDEQQRRKSLLGLSLFSNFRKDGDVWKGRIYNPEDGRQYRASVRQLNANQLRLKGCWGPFCQSQRWLRLRSVQLPTEAELQQRR
ncbi:DUF2147 domain-containing protein [Granulosicoccus antarcticus]|nr:DUF2147 domain-containing protein [Granulosicoccus antarcticus]